MKANDATLRQIEAADPGANTWLSANAGSGKTRVLTDRVARLLLTGVSPQNILCLTYTKAAASEMQNRLFDRLGGWSMQSDADLRKNLSELGVDDVDDLARARRLFAAALETPGGLKIQTIHSFCAAILRRFPLEAGVSPQFQEMDERSARILQTELLDDMACGPDRALLAALAGQIADTDLAGLTREILSRREAFAQPVTDDQIRDWFGLPPGFGEADVPAMAFDGSERDLVARAGPVLAGQSPTMQSLAADLAALDFDAPGRADLEALYGAFLFKANGQARAEAKFKSVPTKNAALALGADLAPFHAFMERVAKARGAEIALGAARKTRVLYAFAAPFIDQYEARKQARGWLDFDDLIALAGRLLRDPALAAWVLYRLDGGIDHILVDEAQDTSPAQWRVIESLAREFTSGESAHESVGRTLFVVGDVKQSIYSFQGADPSEFDRMKAEFGAAFGNVGQKLNDMQLEYSFRSAWAILSAVDQTLDAAPGLGDAVKHLSLDHTRPGRVDLWPVIEKDEAEAERHWADPVDAVSSEDPAVQLAAAIAREIKAIIETGTVPGKEGAPRPITPGDIMVLVQRRSALFHEIIRACKALNLPIAGADRLRIGGELAVKDLTALLAFLATPEDDLSLAAVLRSPLCGLTEDDLFRLAHGRNDAYLWRVLRDRGDAFPKVVAMLTELRDRADFDRPYELLDRALTRFDGRRSLIARLGREAEDGIDALLAQALAFERVTVPGLTAFLTWLAADEVEIKRQMDSAGDQIRVMTVHGAKGLEAPVVILPDTAKRRPPNPNRLVPLASGTAWRVAKGLAPEPIADAAERERERADEEDMRLLYVAMTRAETWLIVAAAGNVGDPGSADCWYRIVENGLGETDAVAHDFALGRGLRYETGAPFAPASGARAEDKAKTVALPDWAQRLAPAPAEPPKPLVPSDLGGAKALPGDSDTDSDLETALRRGRQIHRLLEFLPDYPPETWPEMARGLLAFGEDSAGEDEALALLETARKVLTAPDLGFLFGPETLAEVEISAPVTVGGADRVHGIIDRLVIGPDRILAVDFKTNRIVPETPETIPDGILRQMGAYEAALAEVFPGREISSAVLWTHAPSLMELPPGLALRTFGRLDVGGPRS